MRSVPWLLCVPILWSCGGGGGDTDDTDGDTDVAELQWYTTCGDPVCQGYTGPFDGVPLCADTDVAVGESCANPGEECDPVDDCNARLRCTDEDPTQQTGGCPISLSAFKKEIHYLTEAERDEAARELLSVKLATWRYRQGDDAQRMGFLIDDLPGSVAVRPDGGHVDLYGYLSLAVAALQRQDAVLAGLEARVAELEGQCAQP